MGWKETLSSAAPLIATALGGPLGGLAVGLASQALSLSDKTETAIAAAVTGATPDQLAALKQADYNFALKKQELENKYSIDLATIDANDRASARNREIAAHDTWTPRIVAAVIIAGFFLVLYLMMRNEVPTAARDAFLVLTGYLGAAFTAIVSYYFGSSSGSAQKTKQIEAMTRQN